MVNINDEIWEDDCPDCGRTMISRDGGYSFVCQDCGSIFTN